MFPKDDDFFGKGFNEQFSKAQNTARLSAIGGIVIGLGFLGVIVYAISVFAH